MRQSRENKYHSRFYVYLREAQILPEEDGYGGGVVVCFELECCEVADVLLLLVSDFKLSLSGLGALNV